MAHGPLVRYGFLLVPDFTLIAFSSAIEALRMANLSSQQELYRWSVLTLDDRAVRSSAALEIQPSGSLANAQELDALFVCAGLNVERHCNPQLDAALRRLAGASLPLGALCTGTYLLAKAGVLDDHCCTIHWEYLTSLKEEFPKLEVKDEVFLIDRKRYTCVGGTAPLDMMLHLVTRDHGRELSLAISEQFSLERIRSLGEPQLVPVRHRAPGVPEYLSEAVELMKNNIGERLLVRDISNYLEMSTRQLERAFKRHFSCSPSQYYLRLRLNAARNLLRHSSMAVRGIAIETGFKALPHFSKCYCDHFKIRPSQERAQCAF